MSRLAITTSSGRRVSMLCEDEGSYFHTYASSPSPPFCPSLSPDFRRPSGSDRSNSFSSIASSSAYSNGPLTPLSPHHLSLPPLDQCTPSDAYPKSVVSRSTPDAASSTASSSPHLATRSTSMASTQSDETDSAGLAAKRLTRKYTCHCHKSFTTSGHLARHSRIHTGEKNYACPEPTCGARFSRQDNCMQHYRTHQGGGSNKRSTRKKRADVAPVIVSNSPQLVAHRHPYYSDTPFSAEEGLSALANVAITGYP